MNTHGDSRLTNGDGDQPAARIRSLLADLDTDLARWRTGVLADMQRHEDAQPERDPGVPEGRDPAPPPDAPPGYHRIRDLVEQGQRDWVELLDAGDSDDPAVREVHLWLARRLDLLRQALPPGSEDLTEQQALAALASAWGTATGAVGHRDEGGPA